MSRWQVNRVLCECGELVTEKMLTGRHLESIGHKAIVRIAALLEKECITMAEIAARVGCTRELVRQIVKKRFEITGRERQFACAKKHLEINVQHEFSLLFKVCPFPIEAVKRIGTSRVRPRHKKVIVNGWMCHYGRASLREDGKIITLGRMIKATLRAVDFVILEIPETESFMVIPVRAYRSTAFTVDPDPRYGAHSHNHGWRDYINAWHLLERKGEKE